MTIRSTCLGDNFLILEDVASFIESIESLLESNCGFALFIYSASSWEGIVAAFSQCTAGLLEFDGESRSGWCQNYCTPIRLANSQKSTDRLSQTDESIRRPPIAYKTYNYRD